jgi:hypothetical protein
MIRIVDIPPSELEAKAAAKPANAKPAVAAAPAPAPATGDQREAILVEVTARWSKLSKRAISALNDRDDLVGQLVTKYKMKRPQAERDVDDLLNGRSF